MSVYKKKNGKYYCRFQIDGERHHYLCVGATSEKEAKKLESQYMFKVQQQQNGVIPKNELTKIKLKKLKENYLEYSKINRTVYKQDIGRIKIIFEFFNEDKYADSITRKDIEAFKAWLLAKKRSKKTINLYLGICRKMYNLAIANEWISKNPFTNNVEFKLEPIKIKYLTGDAQRVLAQATPDFFKPVIITALNSGLRRGNIIDLQWSNLDFNFRTIEITKNKGNKYIKLPMNDTLYNLFLSMERVSDFIFINPETKDKWKTTAFNKQWRKIRDKAGLKDFKFHGLRHTVGTRLIKENIPVPVVKGLLAHSDIKTTMQYIHVDSLDMINAMNVLDSYN